MTFEFRRSRLRKRQWGESVGQLPYTGAGGLASVDLEAREGPTFTNDHNPRDALDALVDSCGHTYVEIPMPASTTLISTKGWSLDTLIEKGDNFQQVHRVSAASSSLLETIVEFDKKGIPLVLEGWHKHPNWPHDKFTPEYFASNTTPNINVRNIHDWTDSEMPLLEYIDKSRAISPFVVDGENERLYGKDAECPESWEDWLHNGKAIPPSLVCNGPDDLFRYRPNSAPVETLMCYLGIGDTFTPCHKDLCGSSGQNVMCYTENDGSSFWFMTESASAPLVADYFHSLGQELDHENYVVSIEELSRAPFKVYIVEQKLGDMVLVPPRSCHQVVNYGGITLKTSWSRMTFKGLATAYYHELPLYRRVCRFETYRVKSTIHWALVGQTKELKTLLCDAGEPGSTLNPLRGEELTASPPSTIHKPDSGSTTPQDQSHADRKESQAKNLRELLLLYDIILADEYETYRGGMARRAPCDVDSFEDDNRIVCDFCGGDIFQSFFECRKCVVDGASDGYVVCPGCYVEGRSCKCFVMEPMQCRNFQQLTKARFEAFDAVKSYEMQQGRSFACELNISSVDLPGTFRAACLLLQIRKNQKKDMKVCTLPRAHSVRWALTCKKCHNAKCFSHILTEHYKHAIEALLLQDADSSHDMYHQQHLGAKYKFKDGESALRKSQINGTQPPFSQLMAYNALNFGHCKPVNSDFMELGWYDTSAQVYTITDEDDCFPAPISVAETLVNASELIAPGVDYAESDLTDLEDTDIEDLTIDYPEDIDTKVNPRSGKRNLDVYVDIPPAPYRISRVTQQPAQTSDLIDLTEGIRHDVAATSLPVVVATLTKEKAPDGRNEATQRMGPRYNLNAQINCSIEASTFRAVPTTIRRPGTAVLYRRKPAYQPQPVASSKVSTLTGQAAQAAPIEPVVDHSKAKAKLKRLQFKKNPKVSNKSAPSSSALPSIASQGRNHQSSTSPASVQPTGAPGQYMNVAYNPGTFPGSSGGGDQSIQTANPFDAHSANVASNILQYMSRMLWNATVPPLAPPGVALTLEGGGFPGPSQHADRSAYHIPYYQEHPYHQSHESGQGYPHDPYRADYHERVGFYSSRGAYSHDGGNRHQGSWEYKHDNNDWQRHSPYKRGSQRPQYPSQARHSPHSGPTGRRGFDRDGKPSFSHNRQHLTSHPVGVHEGKPEESVKYERMSWDRTDNGTFASSSHMQRHPWRGRGRYQHNRFSGPSYRGRGRSQQFEYTDNQGSTHRHSIGRGVDSMNSVPQHRTNSFDRGIGPFDDHSMQSETPSLDHEVSLFPTTGEAIVESQNVVHSMASDLPDEDNFDTWKMPTMVNEERDDSQWEDAYDMTDEIIADVVVEDKPQVVVDNILAKEEVVVDMGGLEDNPWSIS